MSSARRLNAEIQKLQNLLETNEKEYKAIHEQVKDGIVTLQSIRLLKEIKQLRRQLKDLNVRLRNVQYEETAAAEPPQKRIKKTCSCGCSDLVENDGHMTCPECGNTNLKDRTIDTTPGFKDAPGTKHNGYMPSNHFAEILAQFQGKRRAYPPADVVALVEKYCDNYRIPQRRRTPTVVRKMLRRIQRDDDIMNRQKKLQEKFRRRRTKPARRTADYTKQSAKLLRALQVSKKGKIYYKYNTVYTEPEKAPPVVAAAAAPVEDVPVVRKYTDYYKHAVEISKILNKNVDVPELSESQEREIKALFDKAVEAYKTSDRYKARKKNRGNRRKEEPNIQNYFYILYKILHMCGYEEFLSNIPLPKSVTNIKDNDENGWKHICQKNGWAYTPTI
jgi:hypothetical protein